MPALGKPFVMWAPALVTENGDWRLITTTMVVEIMDEEFWTLNTRYSCTQCEHGLVMPEGEPPRWAMRAGNDCASWHDLWAILKVMD